MKREEYLPSIGVGKPNQTHYEALDRLSIGQTYEIPKRERTIASVGRIKWYWHLKRDRILRVHSTSRGYMFVRIE